MADQPTEKPAPAVDGQDVAPAAELSGKQEETKDQETKGDDAAPATEEKKEEETPAAGEDTEMPDAEAAATAEKTIATSTSSKNRRKSAGGASRKSLNKKQSKAKMTHLDAKPGDYFLVKLKGFPEWPAVVCDEDMLPQALLTTRPVTAAKPDGTYAEQYADGGKRVSDRNFPVMYLYTNEFGWVINTALTELTAEGAKKALDGKLRKDLREAFELAADHHPLDHYKDLLRKFEEEQEAREREIEAQEKARLEAAATPKKSKKAKASDDADGESKAKKRKADDASTPQRTDSAKKPKIKINMSASKNANGTTPQAKDASKAKPKTKKADAKDKMTPEERLARKEKEVLYLRYKLQRGLLNKDQPPKEDEMKQMSEYLTMLENVGEQLEVAIIRATRINKVLKQILKLSAIPREAEFNFKSRSQKILDKWNQVLSTAEPADKEGAAKEGANGVNGDGKKSTPEAGDKAEAKDEAKKEDTPAETKAEDEPAKKEENGDAAVEAA